RIVIGMDLMLFLVGLGLMAISVVLALRENKPLDSLSTVVTGGSGLLAVVYARFFARPRAQVEASVQYLSGLKAVFLGQLRQTDQAYTRRVLEDEKIVPSEVEAYNAMIERTMRAALTQLNAEPPRSPADHTDDRDEGSAAHANGKAAKAAKAPEAKSAAASPG